MTKIYILLLLSLAMMFSSVNAQEDLSSLNSRNGDPQVERIMVEKGKTISDFFNSQSLRAVQTEVNPGIDPEGDYVHRMAYSADGTYLLQANAITNNVTVFDAETMEVVANVQVGFFPVDVACTENYAVVPCVFADSVFVIDLSDFSIAATFTTGEQPATVEVSHDGNKAFVGCDIDDVVEVINLETMTHESTISNFPVALKSANWITGSGRFYYTWHQFLLSPDDQAIITSNYYDGKILQFGVESGTVEKEIDGFNNITELNFSGDGEVLVAVENATPATVYQIDYNNFEISAQVTFDGLGIWGGGVAVNPDGSKAFLGVNGNQTALVRFETQNYTLYPTTQTAFWCDNTYDHLYAVSGQFRFTIFDFEAELIEGSYWGVSQYLGAVSPTAYQAAGVDPGRYEGPAFYDFANPATVTFKGQKPSGEVPEGDVPYFAAVCDDGSKGVVVNNLSNNVSIINLENYEVEDVIEIGEAGYEVEITHDSKYAIVGGYDLNTIKIIDLENNELIQSVVTGQRPMMIAIAPDDSYAYIGNLKSNSVSFVKLDGANSVNEKTISCGVIGVNWSAYGVRSAVEVSPTGEYLLVAASFDDNVKVFDTETQEIVATVPTGDFPLQIAFNADGTFAVVTNLSGNTYSVISIDGANSSLVGTFNAGNSGPIRLAYNEVKDEVSIVHYSDSHIIYNVDPETGDVLSTFSYPQHGAPSQIAFDPDGLPLVLVAPTDTKSAFLIHDNYGYALPSSPIHFAYSPEAQIAVVAEGGGGPDNVSIIDFVATGTNGPAVIESAKLKSVYITNISPNPANKMVNISYWKSEKINSTLNLKIHDLNGNEILNQVVDHDISKNDISIDVSGFSPGVCFITLGSGSYSATKKLIVK